MSATRDGARSTGSVDESVLSVRGLRVDLRLAKDRASVPLVRGIDFDLMPGRITGLAGESGCGKSLTLLALLGLLDGPALTMRADRLDLDGMDLLALDEAGWRAQRGRRMAMVFQDPGTALDPVFTVGRQLESTLRRAGAGAKEAAERSRKALAAVGFADPGDIRRAYPHQLSGGMRQLVMIAMARAVRPRVLLADEPTTALDVTTQARVIDALRDTAERDGAAVLLVSHDLRVLAQCAAETRIMYAGRIVEHAPGRTLFEAPSHPYSAGLLKALPGMGNRRAVPIGGQVPAPDRLPSGCAYRTRCARATAPCRERQPELRQSMRGARAFVACHHPIEPGEEP
jgi:oligopeptide/dipeptide ABC transporter ATP-binding protein